MTLRRRCLALPALLLLLFPCTLLAEEARAAETVIDSGDTAWMLVCAAMVLLMTPGLAFFYGGLVRRKNILSVLMQGPR